MATQYPMRASGLAGAFASRRLPEKKSERVFLVIIALDFEERDQLLDEGGNPRGQGGLCFSKYVKVGWVGTCPSGRL